MLILNPDIIDLPIHILMSSGVSITFKHSVNDSINFHCTANIIFNSLKFTESDRTSLNYTNYAHMIIPRNCLKNNQLFHDIFGEISSPKGEVCLCSLCLHNYIDFFSQNLTNCSCSKLTQFKYTFPQDRTTMKNLELRTRRWPDMMGKMVEVVTFHRPISTIIRKNETNPMNIVGVPSSETYSYRNLMGEPGEAVHNVRVGLGRMVGLSLLELPVSVWAMIHLHLQLTREQLPAKTKPPTLNSYVIYTLGSITGGSGMLSMRKELPVRVLVSWWYTFILLLCNSYNSKIMACLTLPSYTPKINNVQQLVEQQFAWGRPYKEDNLSKHLDFKKYWHREFAKNFVVYNESNHKTMLLSKRFALNVQQIESCDHLFMDNPIDEELVDNFRVMKEKIVVYRCAIVFRKHSPLLPVFNNVLERLIETGLVQHFKEDAVRRFQRPAYKRILLEHDYGIRSNEISAFTLKNYNFMLYLYFFGLIISIGCFLIELCSKHIGVL